MDFQFLPTGALDVPEIAVKETVQLPADSSAVVVVDMQNDFVKPGGTLVVPAAADTIEAIQQLLTNARSNGVHVAYTQDTHVEGDPEWEIWPEHCRQDTWGWQIIEELQPQPEDLICRKSRYDGFYDTWLDHYLTRVWGVKHLVVVGTVASICVLHTAGSAGLRWFHVVTPANGISAMNSFDQALALRQVGFLYNGDVVRSVGDIEFR